MDDFALLTVSLVKNCTEVVSERKPRVKRRHTETNRVLLKLPSDFLAKKSIRIALGLSLL